MLAKFRRDRRIKVNRNSIKRPRVVCSMVTPLIQLIEGFLSLILSCMIRIIVEGYGSRVEEEWYTRVVLQEIPTFL